MIGDQNLNRPYMERHQQMMKQPYCKTCGHPAHRGDCGVDDCGCVHYEARPSREDRQRTWIVRVEFFEQNRWMLPIEVKVRAQGIGGASMKAVRLVKHERESRRRVLQTRITIVPVPKGPTASQHPERVAQGGA